MSEGGSTLRLPIKFTILNGLIAVVLLVRGCSINVVFENGKVIKIFEEEGKSYKGNEGDPFEVSDVDTMIKYLKETQPKKVVKKKTTRTRKKKTNVETPKD